MGTKISALPAASALTGFETFPAVQSLADVGATANQLKTFVLSGLAAVASSGSAGDLSTGTLASGRLPAFTGGDVTSSAGSANLTIGNTRVTRAMLAATSGAALLGATSAGAVNDLSIASVKSLLAFTAADIGLTVNSQSANYQAALADQNAWVRFTGSSPQTFTIPQNSAVAFPVGTEIAFSQSGSGSVTVSAGTGATVNSRGGLLSTAGQYAVASLKQVAANVWVLTGDLA